MSRMFLLLVLCACVRAEVLSVKGIYCQDPDTGRLYGVNTTWPSTTFCGNYTCKIRMRNQDMDHASSRTIINITKPDFEMENEREVLKELPKETEKNDNIVIVKKDDIKTKPIYHKNNAINANLNNVHLKSISLPLHNSIDDRFLNNEEIKTISELLHTVKKSDLEAIVEIYNLAQDIYKEMDAATTDSAVKEVLNNVTEKTEKESQILAKSNEVNNVKSEFTSYWYEPSGLHGFRKLAADLKSEGSEYRPMPIKPYEFRPNIQGPQTQTTQAFHPTQTTTITQPAYATQSTHPTYFSGLLTNQDFGRLSYYYPMSNFQRLASYYNQRIPYDLPPVPAQTPCSPACHRNHIQPIYRDHGRPYNPLPKSTAEVPSLLLPFPFSVQLYNTSAYPYNNYNNYYKGNPWAYYDYYKNSPYHQPYLPNGQVPKNDVLVNPEIVSQDKEEKPLDNGKKSVISEKPIDDLKPWQTEPLSDAVIAEVRANIAERAKLLKIPYKKRIKLERVAKVIKLDHLNRHKRDVPVKVQAKTDSAERNDLFEAYIEKTTCDTNTELGFFRVGNMSQPYPACCPQKIEGR